VRALRKLVLGETWTLPIGIGVALGLAAAVRALVSDDTWRDVGGFVLLGFVVVALAVALAPAHRARGG
jgi:hypothetical protein